MANTPAVDWVKINDFRPGIAQKTGIVYPLGQATDTNTYRCIANDGGALVPLPRRSDLIDGIDYNSGDPSYGYKVSGIFAAGPIIRSGGDIPIEVFVATEYISSSTRRFRVELHKLYESPVTSDTIVSIDSTETSPGDTHRGVPFVLTRDNRGDPTASGLPIIAFCWYAGSGTGSDEKKAWIFPNSSTPSSDTPYEFINGTAITYIAGHQNRIILFKLSAVDHGVDGSWVSNEDLYWTAVNNVDSITTASGSGGNISTDGPSVLVAENPTGYSFAVSMASNELFLAKSFGGGGLFVLGDMDNPTVQNLPNLPAIGAEMIEPALTPIGVLFPTRYTGAWVWGGGNSAEKVSSHMDEEFWWPTSEPSLSGLNATCARWGDWVALPRNWIFDSGTGGWWRLEQESVANIRWFREVIGQPGRLIGAVSSYTSAEENIVSIWSRYDSANLANSFSWQSQPIPQTMDREVDVKEVMLTARGTGTVEVTLTGRGGANDNTIFNVNSTFPVQIRHSIKTTGSFIQVRIESTGTGSGNAPEVHDLQLGVHPLNIVGREQ